MRLFRRDVAPLILRALGEDIGRGDITSLAIFEKDLKINAYIVANQSGVVAGVDVARWVFGCIDRRISTKALCMEGARVMRRTKIISLAGPVKSILAAERVALNFLGRISGVATLTRRFVKRVRHTGVKIYDTRKTTPGIRMLEKYAVRVGGGYNHRMGLWDGVLIKDNHLNSLKFKVKSLKLKGIEYAVEKARWKKYKNIEIEVGNLREFMQALEAGANIIMLDNFRIEDIKKAVKINRSMFKGRGARPILEASGGITLENVRSIAETGVDRISIGALTHSAPALDFSMLVCG